jgi:nicotinamidase-related amidase
MLLTAARSHLVVVDIQERLMPAIHEGERVARNTRTLLAAATRLHIPIAVTEQYPRGLGHTVAEVADHLPESARRYEKIHFSAAAEPHIAGEVSRAAAEGRDQLVICGCEAHVCVLQTALGFREAGYSVFLVGDAISSRAPHSLETAKARALHAGCHLVTTEMVVFEWLAKAGTDEFRALSALIK